MKKALLFLSLIIASFAYSMEETQPVNPFQKNPLLLFSEEKERALAFAMALQPRLGADSPASRLPRELVRKIMHGDVDTWLEQNHEEIERWRNAEQREKDNALRRRAANVGNLNPIRILLYAGANVNAAGPDADWMRVDTYTSLHIVALRGHAEIAKIFLAVGANFDAVNKHGYTPLHCAAEHGHLEVVKALLDAGADRILRDKFGTTAAEGARLFNNDIVAELIEPSLFGPRFHRFVTHPLTFGIMTLAAVVVLTWFSVTRTKMC